MFFFRVFCCCCFGFYFDYLGFFSSISLSSDGGNVVIHGIKGPSWNYFGLYHLI